MTLNEMRKSRSREDHEKNRDAASARRVTQEGNHSPGRVSTVLSCIIFTKSTNSCAPNSETAM